jgi:TatD DNase family protein
VSLIDTHAHLDAPQFAADRDTVIARARAVEVEIISVSTDLESSETTLRLSESYNLFCAVGIHPHEAARYVDGVGAVREPSLQERLAALAKNPRVVAIGEIGLDYFKDYAPRSVQQKVFRAQLALARELDLPVIIHMRDSAEDVLAELQRFQGLKGVIHSFTGDRELASRIIAQGFYLGFNGIITFNRVGA